MGVNDDLLAPLESETFANDAVSGTASYPKSGGNGTNSAGAATVTFVYDAATGAYFVGTSGRSQTFDATHLDSTASNGQIDVYVRTNGSTTDSLTLTRPGTGGRLTYRYVGAGFWQRTIDGASTISGSVDSFTYGVRTLDASVPRTGRGSFTTDILGVYAFSNNLTSFFGEGVLAVDFATGDIDLNGTYSIIDSTTGIPNPPLRYDGSATLSTSSNEFTGNIHIFPFANTLTGRFYGPGADELGAVFHGSDGNNSIQGTLIGRRAGSGDGPDGLLTLVGDQQFAQLTGHLVWPDLAVGAHRFELDAGGNPIAGANELIRPTQVIVNYDTGHYRFLETNTLLAEFTVADLVVAESDASFAVYRKTSGGRIDELRVSQPGASNPTIALTYTAFGNWVRSEPAATPGNTTLDDHYFAYGMLTNPTIFPTTGSAIYNGLLLGSGVTRSGGNNLYYLSGSFGLTADFAAGSVTGSMAPILTDMNSASVLNFSAMPIFGTILASSAQFDAGFTAPNVNSSNNYFVGNFFGPTAEEIGASFSGNVANPGDISEVIGIKGVAVGNQD